jgi:cytochrome c peroxidase
LIQKPRSLDGLEPRQLSQKEENVKMDVWRARFWLGKTRKLQDQARGPEMASDVSNARAGVNNRKSEETIGESNDSTNGFLGTFWIQYTYGRKGAIAR